MLRFTRYHKKAYKNRKIDWVSAPDVKTQLSSLKKKLHLEWLNLNNIYCIRSSYAHTRALARIWGLGRIWQIALFSEPKYIIEVISERFDALGEIEQNKVLLHEIAHIPKNFSGSLMPHIRRGRNKFENKVRFLVAQYLKQD